MAQGDVVSIEAYTNSTAYDFTPSSGVEWCITSMWSTQTWYLMSVAASSFAYALQGQNLDMKDNNSKIFVASGSNQQLRVNANNYWQTFRITGVVTKE